MNQDGGGGAGVDGRGWGVRAAEAQRGGADELDSMRERHVGL